MRPRVIATLEYLLVALSCGVWAALLLLPESWAVVPEYMVACNVALIVAALVILAAAIRRIWARLGRRSLPVAAVLLFIACLLTAGPIEDLEYQLREASSEGFYYGGGWLCSTHVDNIAAGPAGNDRVYVLQDYCVPDGPQGAPRAYLRRGDSPLMQRHPGK